MKRSETQSHIYETFKETQAYLRKAFLLTEKLVAEFGIEKTLGINIYYAKETGKEVVDNIVEIYVVNEELLQKLIRNCKWAEMFFPENEKYKGYWENLDSLPLYALGLNFHFHLILYMGLDFK